MPLQGNVMKDYIAVYNGSMDKGCWLRLRNLAWHLAEEGHRVHLAVPEDFTLPVHSNITRLPLKRPRRQWLGLNKLVSGFHGAWQAMTLARRSEAPVWLAFDTHNGLCFLAGRWLQVPKVLFIRGKAKYQGKYNEPLLYGWLIRALNRSIKRRADAIIYNNSSASNSDAALHAKHAIQPYTLYNDSSLAPQCRFATGHGPFTVGYCGQLSKRKNVEFLIQAFIAMDDPQARLIIKGNWEKYAWAQHYRDVKRFPNIEFRSWGQDMRGFYNDIDLFVLPSLFDDFSNAALDAIAQGIPVLLSNTGGSPEMVDQDDRLLFDLAKGERHLAERLRYVRDHYPMACREVESLTGKYHFDWPGEVSKLLKRITDRPRGVAVTARDDASKRVTASRGRLS